MTSSRAPGPAQLVLRVVEQHRDRVARSLSASLLGTVPAKIDYRVRGENQVERWIQSEWFLESDRNGQPTRAILINLNVTDRKEAEHRLRESEERYRFGTREELTTPARQKLTTNRPRVRCLSDEHGLVALGLAARLKRSAPKFIQRLTRLRRG